MKWLGITVASVEAVARLQLSITTAGLTAGAVALVVAILLPAGEEAAGH